MNSIGKRIDKTIKDSGLTQREFAEKIGVSEQAIGNYINNRRFPKAEILLKMKQSFGVSVDWLLTETESPSQEQTDSPIEMKGVPLIPADAMAGFGEGDTQVMWYDAEKYVVPEFSELNVDFMIRVKGSSMYPKYSSGDLVACKKVPLTDIFFQWNKVYVLDTIQGPLIKRIHPGKDDLHILLISENEAYQPFSLHKDEIHAVAIVVGVIRFE